MGLPNKTSVSEVSLFGFYCFKCKERMKSCLMDKNKFPMHNAQVRTRCNISYRVTLNFGTYTQIGRKDNKIVQVLAVEREDLWD